MGYEIVVWVGMEVRVSGTLGGLGDGLVGGYEGVREELGVWLGVSGVGGGGVGGGLVWGGVVFRMLARCWTVGFGGEGGMY